MMAAPITSEKARANRRVVWSILWWIRQLSGDAAYENYLRCVGRVAASEHVAGRKPLSRKEFYLDSLRRRFSTASRCC
jgi:putative selenoprotein